MLAHKFCSLRGTENHDKHARCPLSNDTMFWLMFLLVSPTAIQNPLCIKFGSVNKSPASNGPREKNIVCIICRMRCKERGSCPLSEIKIYLGRWCTCSLQLLKII